MNHKRFLQRHRLAGDWTRDPGAPSRPNHILVGVSIAIWTLSFTIQHKSATATGCVLVEDASPEDRRQDHAQTVRLHGRHLSFRFFQPVDVSACGKTFSATSRSSF